MNYPSVGASEIQQLRQYQAKNSYTDAQVAELMTVFGWTWSETHVADLLNGRLKPTETEQEFIKRFMLNKFFDYNIS